MERIEAIAKEHPKAILLREKDVSESEYAFLAKNVIQRCNDYDVPCILHSFPETALALGVTAIHMPLPLLRTLDEDTKAKFTEIGTSCHSMADAAEAEKLGCTYLIAGHIFPTDCKKDKPPRGLDFLREVCKSVHIPVYAIGGIDVCNMDAVKACGANGGCMMSSLMTCPDVREFMKDF